MNALADPFTRADWLAAEQMHLGCEPASDQAKSLVSDMLASLHFPQSDKHPRPSTSARRQKALGALLADLTRCEHKGCPGSHGMGRADFPAKRLGFGFEVFKSLKDAMVAAGLLEFNDGRPRWGSFAPLSGGSGPVVKLNSGYVSRFRLTSLATERVIASGVTLEAWETHWTRNARCKTKSSVPLPAASLVVLRASSRRLGGRRLKGEEMPIDSAEPAVQAIIADLQIHNAFLIAKGVDGIDFNGLRRIFNEGEIPEKRWRSGGRYYSVPIRGVTEAYERMSGDDRRSLIRLGGSAVGEVDMSASQLRLLYALLDQDLPPAHAADPYKLPGLERGPAKLVVAQALGKAAGRSKSWGMDAKAAYAKENSGRSLKDDFNFQHYQEAVLAAHPVLERLGHPQVPTGLGLQYFESEVVRTAMGFLRDKGTPSLPVHDSLIVPLPNLDEAQVALKVAFRSQVELVINKPTQHHAVVNQKGTSRVLQ